MSRLWVHLCRDSNLEIILDGSNARDFQRLVLRSPQPQQVTLFCEEVRAMVSTGCSITEELRCSEVPFLVMWNDVKRCDTLDLIALDSQSKFICCHIQVGYVTPLTFSSQVGYGAFYFWYDGRNYMPKVLVLGRDVVPHFLVFDEHLVHFFAVFLRNRGPLAIFPLGSPGERDLHLCLCLWSTGLHSAWGREIRDLNTLPETTMVAPEKMLSQKGK